MGIGLGDGHGIGRGVDRHLVDDSVGPAGPGGECPPDLPVLDDAIVDGVFGVVEP